MLTVLLGDKPLISFWLDILNLERPIVYIEGSHLSVNIVFSILDSIYPGEMPHHAAFYLGLHCLSQYHLKIQIYKVLNNSNNNSAVKVTKKHFEPVTIKN